MQATNMTNSYLAADPLKGLLMDKGASGLENKIRNLLHKLAIVHESMDDLVALQKMSREEASSDSIDLYLATNIRKDLVGSELIKSLKPKDMTVYHTKAPLVLEWRSRVEFGQKIGCARSARVYAFQKDHEHSLSLKKFVTAKSPGYYETLVGYDILRVTLNNASRQLRKLILDLTSVYEETGYIGSDVKAGETKSKRILKGLNTQHALMEVLNGLYCY